MWAFWYLNKNIDFVLCFDYFITWIELDSFEFVSIMKFPHKNGRQFPSVISLHIGSEGSHSLPLSALSGVMSVFAKMTNPKKKALKNQGFARIWWRRRESNPRPEILYEEIYILSLVIWI